MNCVIRNSSEELQELYYSLGVKNELPSSWDGFKDFLIIFCVYKSLFTMKKYIDEFWGKYLTKLVERGSFKIYCENLI
jgi:hypothetical protein